MAHPEHERRAASRGFTLVELMIVVAIVVVLSFIAGGAYRRYLDNARKTEVYAMFAEIRSKEEAYRAELSAYAPAAGVDTTYFPALNTCAAGSNEPCAKSWTPSPAWWTGLNLSPGKAQLYCGYSVVSGAANTTPGQQYGGPAFNNTTPASPWWYAVATCDNDNDPTVNAIFVTTSDRDTVWEQNVHN